MSRPPSSHGLRAIVVGFAIALLGTAGGFYGSYIESRAFSVFAFAVVCGGIVVGTAGIFVTWYTMLRHGRILRRSWQSAEEIRRHVRTRWLRRRRR